ncbi:MAG: tetratricopeptide repeat protein [Bacteroidota bacterium]|nr:tetratricopeptide repeat protein [Bacteroidota bacterium]
MKTTKQNILIEKFLENKLSANDVVEIRKLMQKNTFFRESLLGYIETNSHPEDLNLLDEKWNPKPNRINRKFRLIGLSIAASFALLFFLKLNDTHKTQYQPLEQKHYALETYNLPIVIISPNRDTIRESDKNDVQNKPAHYAYYKKTGINESPEREKITPLYRKSNLSIETVYNNSEINSDWMTSSNHLYGFLDKYKIVDYRVDNRKNKTDFTIPDRHNKSVSNNYSDNKSEIPYMNFLAEALTKFDAENYHAALYDFRTILVQYPNDMNALFYAGLCHYHTNNQEKCIAVMNRILNAKINTFDQDANWYQAMSYKSIQDIKQTRILLTEISQSNSYYGVMANDELKKLNNIK